ncbi:MAG: hypothetical protein ACW98Y_21985, partial [Candidatus Thorarchaeota archaeon]
MSLLHIIGFGIRPKISLKYRLKWHQRFPEDPLKIDPGDAVILNLLEVHDAKTVERIRTIVKHIGKNGGLVVVISAPLRYVSDRLTNYHFLPWPDEVIGGIQNYNGFLIRAADAVPSWVDGFLFRVHKELFSPVCFKYTPSGAISLMEGPRCGCVSVNYQHIQGRILIFPPIKSIIHGQADSSARRESTSYLESLISTILTRFWKPSEAMPDWLDSIGIRNEDELRDQYQTLGNELD